MVVKCNPRVSFYKHHVRIRLTADGMTDRREVSRWQ
jgi:hypothetical protein